ncbi:MAG TPA: hypothetical protein VIH33_02110 [Candidatus Limnocylindria bacterium]|jgi:hypothetical protein
MNRLTVSCARHEAEWRCEVTVGDDAAATHHQVDIATADLQRLHPGAASPEALVRAAFEFLLTREPRESILRRFELPVIGRYFPEWESEITRRLAAG